MSTKFNINNEGVGGTPYLTFHVNPGKGFTQGDLDTNLSACAVVANNQVGKAVAGEKLFGKVVSVSQELQEGVVGETHVPVICAVQARGVARFKYSDPPPVINGMVATDGTGKVRRVCFEAGEMASYPDFPGFLARGQVIAIDTDAETCDVWLG